MQPAARNKLRLVQGSYGSGKTWKTWKMGLILKKSGKKSGKTRKMGKSQGKGQGKYFACHDQYFSCTIMKKIKKILITVKKLLSYNCLSTIKSGKIICISAYFPGKWYVFNHKKSGKVRENQNEILSEPCIRRSLTYQVVVFQNQS